MSTFLEHCELIYALLLECYNGQTASEIAETLNHTFYRSISSFSGRGIGRKLTFLKNAGLIYSDGMVSNYEYRSRQIWKCTDDSK